MRLDLSNVKLPIRISFTSKDGNYGHTLAVFQYADGKILSASTAVLDPEDWKSAEVHGNPKFPINSPEWANMSDEERTKYFKDKSKWGIGLGKFVKDAHLPLSSGAVEGTDAPPEPRPYVPPEPKSVTTIGPEDDCSDEEAFGQGK